MSNRHGASSQPEGSGLSIFGGVLLLRVINALAVKTFFQPDEYFQSLEPAWQAAFGPESGAWITWEWREGLRSSLHPLLFAAAYRAASQVSSFLHLRAATRSELLIATPKLLQAIFAASMDFFTYKLASRTYGPRSSAAYAALALTALSPWQAFCSIRTLSNSLDTTLTICALYMWPWDWLIASTRSNRSSQSTKQQATIGTQTNLYLSLGAAALACILRPTNIIVWATVSVTLMLCHGNLHKLLVLAQAACLSGGIVLAVSLSAEGMFYQAWVLPPLRFLQFNLVQSLAVFYGQNRLDYYLTEGLPLLLTTAIPFAIVGMWQALRSRTNDMRAEVRGRLSIQFTLALTVITSVVTLSLISHKEVRFIYPLLPMLHVLAARPMANFFAPFPKPRRNYKRVLLVLIVCVNIFIGYYTLFVHQRGVIDVMHYLRHEHETLLSTSHEEQQMGSTATVGFLMPCHSTPWRSHLVYPGIGAWALTCEPPLNLTIVERERYMDEADVFYDDYTRWINDNMEGLDAIDTATQLPESTTDTQHRRAWPEYLVFFDHLEAPLSTLLNGSQYRECWRGFNTHWHDDWRRQGDVITWCRT